MPVVAPGKPAAYDLIVIAASAGGLAAISEVIHALPRDLPAAVAIVLHRRVKGVDVLTSILRRKTALEVQLANEGEVLKPGVVYLAPADRHLVLRPDRTFELMDGRRIKHLLSSANPLFESAAHALGGRLIAVVLTGGASDATDGVQTVRQRGGVVIAQDKTTSEHFGMPGSAIASGAVDYVLPLKAIGPALQSLLRGEFTP